MLVPKELKFEHSGDVKAMTEKQLERSLEVIKELIAQRREAGTRHIPEVLWGQFSTGIASGSVELASRPEPQVRKRPRCKQSSSRVTSWSERPTGRSRDRCRMRKLPKP
jgi:hypothetical protein